MRRGLLLPVSVFAVVLIGLAGAPRAGFSTPANGAASPHVLPAWTNLLENAGAEAGDASSQGWDAVTIPGWQIRQGLPTVVRYGTAGFPSRSDPGPVRRGSHLFAGGAGGTARLTEQVPIRAGRRCPAPTGDLLLASRPGWGLRRPATPASRCALSHGTVRRCGRAPSPRLRRGSNKGPRASSIGWRRGSSRPALREPRWSSCSGRR